MNIPSRRPFALAVLSLLLLAACGPLAAGDATRVDYRNGATYVAPAGSPLVATVELPLARTGLSVAALRRANLTWIPLGIRGESANAARLVSLATIEAPDDWEVRLWQARIVREASMSDREAPPTTRLEAEIRVDVPASAYDLTRRVRAELVVHGGARVPIDFLVEAE